MESKEVLKNNYEIACNAYLEAFCDKHGFDYDVAKDDWVANVVGDCCMLGDFCVSFDDMRTDIDMDAPKEEYFNYYDYYLEAYELGFICPNYANWLRGCPRLSEEQRKSLRESKNRVYEAQKEFERALKEENEKIAGGL